MFGRREIQDHFRSTYVNNSTNVRSFETKGAVCCSARIEASKIVRNDPESSLLLTPVLLNTVESSLRRFRILALAAGISTGHQGV